MVREKSHITEGLGHPLAGRLTLVRRGNYFRLHP